jgi:hypothetical protein
MIANEKEKTVTFTVSNSYETPVEAAAVSDGVVAHL